jgi:hypothetical protein
MYIYELFEGNNTIESILSVPIFGVGTNISQITIKNNLIILN